MKPTPAGSPIIWWAVLFAAALLLLFYRLCAADVCSYNEAVEGLFVQQLVEHRAGLFPVEGEHQAMYKPPLFHWTALGIDRLFGIGKVDAFNLRLPAAICAAAGLLLIVCFTCTVFGPRTAPLAALVLLGSYQYVSQGRFGRVDMTLTLCEALALVSYLCWLRGWRERGVPSNRWRWVFALALGLGVLAKGPAGALLPLAAVVIFAAIDRRWDAALRAFSPGSALLALAVGACWYAACLAGGRYGILNRQFGSENFGRFFGALGAMPPWYYAVPLLFNSGPLSLLAPAAVADALRAGAMRRGQDRGAALDCVQFLAVFWLTTVVFFTLAAYKRRTYLLPLWPADAVLLAWWIDYRIVPRWGRAVRAAFVSMCAILIAINLIAIPRQEASACGGASFRQAGAQINRIVGAGEPLFVYGMQDPAAMLFYLDREVIFIHGELGDAPPGYVIVPASIWQRERDRAPGLEPILGPTSSPVALILLRHGKAYALIGQLAIQ